MALVEVDEGEYASHRQVTAAMQKLLANPATRKMVLSAQKLLDPNAVIPELDAAEGVRAEIGEVAKTMQAMREEMAAEKAARDEERRTAKMQATWDKGRNKLRATGYTDEGLEGVEKFMEERGIADHEIAAAAFEKLHPPAEPVRGAGGTRFDVFGSEERNSDSMKALFANPDDTMALDSMVNETLRAVRGR